MKKLAILLLAVLLLSTAMLVLPVSAAENEQVSKGIQVAEDAAKMTFPTDGTEGEGICPVCQVQAVWIPLGQENFETAGYRLENGKHYYLTESVEGDNARILAPETGGHVGCIHLNGKDVTSTHASSTTISGSGGQLNIMGSGNLKGGASGGATLGSTVHINTSGKTGSVNLYGGTYSKLTPSGNTNVIAIRPNGGIINIYAGATVKSGTDASAILINGETNRVSATVNIYGGTVDGSASKETTVEIRAAGGSNTVQCNLYAGSIIGGNGKDTPNGGNVFVGKGSSFRMYGGTVTDGEATNGGNIYAEGSVFVYGGTVYGGTATGKGNEIMLAADATGYLLGGKLDGQVAVAAGAKCCLGGNAVAQNGDGAALDVTGTLYLCDGWTGNATVSFPAEYAAGESVPAALAQAVTLQEDLTVTVGGSFNGRLEQLGTTKAALSQREDGSLYVAGLLLVSADGTRTDAADPLTQWAQGSYACIKLCTDAAFADLAGQNVTVDLNGYTLTVGGSGNLQLLDSANDNYDASLCGKLVNEGTVTVAGDVQLADGRRYIALTDGNVTTAHRLEMALTDVTLRTAETGLYYKARYDCDETLAALVKQYGVAVSLKDMPGEDFPEERGETCYTVAAEPFASGAVATSGSVFGIMKDAISAQENAARGEMKIYANAYICLEDMILVGDTKNPGKTAEAEGFDGVAYSLRSVMETVETEYYTYPKSQRSQLDDFYTQWKDKGMDWQLTNIGKKVAVSNEKLSFAQGTSDAWCDVCQKTVAWTAITQQTHGETGIGKDTAGKHYYLAEDITYSGSTNFIQAPSSGSACLHLNGNDLTANAYRVIMGYAGVLNVLGNGNVAGNFPTENRGAAVDINTSASKGAVNLYGGTYREYESTDAAAVSISNNGGAVNVYEGATVAGDIYVGTANLREAKLGIYGGSITGTVTYAGAKKEFAARLETSGQAQIKKLVVPMGSDMTLQGAPVIQLLEMGLGAQIKVSGLAKGTSVKVRGSGVFAEAGDRAADYAQYFQAYFAADSIVAEGSKLVNAVDYTPYLSPWETDVVAQAKADGKIHYYFMASEGLWIRNSHDNGKWGDSCLIVFPDGQTMLVDSGYQDMGPLIWRNLQRMGVTRLDHLVISHPHVDHYGGAFGYTPDAVNFAQTGFLDQIQVARVYINGIDLEDEAGYETVMQGCESHGIPVTVLERGSTMSIGSVSMEVLWPDMDKVDSAMTDMTKDVNDTSIVFRLEHGEHSSLFTGDLYVRGEGWLLGAIDSTKLDVDFLKIPHHARSTSSSEAFVSAVTPELAVATGRAAKGQVDAVYEAANITFLNEWDRGYIHVTADQDGTMTYETTR